MDDEDINDADANRRAIGANATVVKEEEDVITIIVVAAATMVANLEEERTSIVLC